jgi:Tol biopolymer transport system component
MISPGMAWSPDGRYLVYSRLRSYWEIWDVFVYSLAEGIEYRILKEGHFRSAYWLPG